MKRLVVGAIVGTAALALVAPTASANLVNQTALTCESTATWQVTVGLSSYADLAHAPISASDGCKVMVARVEDDLDFALSRGDYIGPGFAKRLVLVGAFVTGVPVFAGVGASADGAVRGPVEIVSEGTLSATLTNVVPGFTWTAAYVPTGSCGPNCYSTKYRVVGTSIP